MASAASSHRLQFASMACGFGIAALTINGPTDILQLLPEIFTKDALIECGDARLEAVNKHPYGKARHADGDGGSCPFAALDEQSGGRLQQYRSQCPSWAPRMTHRLTTKLTTRAATPSASVVAVATPSQTCPVLERRSSNPSPTFGVAVFSPQWWIELGY